MMFKVYYRCLTNFYKLILCEYYKTQQKGAPEFGINTLVIGISIYNWRILC